MQNNFLTLAVAGSRKTQSIVEDCKVAGPDQKILVLTYTKANQDELRSRIQTQVGISTQVEVKGWFSFLIADFVRPFLPFLYPGKHLEGFDFTSEPQMMVPVKAYRRYFTSTGSVRRPHLSHLAWLLDGPSGHAAISRLELMFDVVYIDEVQDLCGYDLEVLNLLLESSLEVRLVGDVRQAILLTNERESKHSKYKFIEILSWFREQEKRGRIKIEQRAQSWRCRPELCELADQLFAPKWGFESTESLNHSSTDHDGIFLVSKADVEVYLEIFQPLFLRNTAATAKNEPFDFLNIGVSKGMTRRRVLIWPTAGMEKFLVDGTMLESLAASKLYVAVTRAEQSVAFVTDKECQPQYKRWIAPVPEQVL